jgi:hypothetical protein
MAQTGSTLALVKRRSSFQKLLEFQKSRFGGPAMIDDNLAPKITTTEPTGIWAYFMNRLSARTGLSIPCLQFLLLLIGSLAAYLTSNWFVAVSWNSAVLLFRVITVVAAVAAVVVLLPSVGRRIVVSLVILFHFGGILTAVTSVNPAPWLSTQLWTTVYRPYLYFMWLNNAYHFYSPQPGPATLMWFCIEYDPDPDGTRNFRWVLVPDLDEEGPVNPDGSRVFSGTEYTRRLSLAEYTGNAGTPPWNLFQLWQQRIEAAQRDGIPPEDPRKVPYDQQYREPDDRSKRWIQTYVRHVASTYKFQDEEKHDLDLPVKAVKFYRVVHQILQPGQVVQHMSSTEKKPNQVGQGMEPNDKSLYWPFYCGEFDKDGNFTESCVKIAINYDGYFQMVNRDPYLYWLIPIDYVTLHAQGPDFEKSHSNLQRAPVLAPNGNESEVKP